MNPITDHLSRFQTKTAFKKSGGVIRDNPLTLFGPSWKHKDQNACIFCFRKMKFAPSKNLYYCKGTKKAPHKPFATKLKNNLT